MPGLTRHLLSWPFCCCWVSPHAAVHPIPKPYIEPVGGDHMLVLDKGGALAPK